MVKDIQYVKDIQSDGLMMVITLKTGVKMKMDMVGNFTQIDRGEGWMPYLENPISSKTPLENLKNTIKEILQRNP